MARQAPHLLALAEDVSSLVRGISGAGQGCDISEFQGSTPAGFDFYIVRLLNENGREDSRWRQHYNQVRAWGKPIGAYGIIRPGPDAGAWGSRYVDLLRSVRWDFVPTVDIELGDPAANVGYAAGVNGVLRGAGFGVLMGYYSAGSAFRQRCSYLYDRHWLAAWGSGYPSAAHVHQWSGSPLDRDYCPSYAAISGGPTPEEDPLAGITIDQIRSAAFAATVGGTKAVLLGDEEVTNHLLSVATHAPQFLNAPGYEAARMTVQDVVHHTPIGVRRDGSVVELGEALRGIWNKANGPDLQLTWPGSVVAALEAEGVPPVTAADLVVPHAEALLRELRAA